MKKSCKITSEGKIIIKFMWKKNKKSYECITWINVSCITVKHLPWTENFTLPINLHSRETVGFSFLTNMQLWQIPASDFRTFFNTREQFPLSRASCGISTWSSYPSATYNIPFHLSITISESVLQRTRVLWICVLLISHGSTAVKPTLVDMTSEPAQRNIFSDCQAVIS